MCLLINFQRSDLPAGGLAYNYTSDCQKFNHGLLRIISGFLRILKYKAAKLDNQPLTNKVRTVLLSGACN